MLRYAITPGKLHHGGSPAHHANLVERCRRLAQEGVDFLLLREKALDVAELLQLTQQVVEAVANTPLRVVVPLAPEPAREAGAHGVHLPAAALKSHFGAIKDKFPQAWISTSCHTLEEVAAAQQLGLEAILFAPIFGKTVAGVEVAPGIGLDRLHEAVQAATPTQVFALGGVTSANAWSCIQAGAAGIAGIRIFFPGP